MTTWKELKKDLVLTPEEQNTIELEKDLMRTMIHIREEKGGGYSVSISRNV